VLSIADLPALNATLNAISAIFLIVGYVFIRRREITKHRACMIAALVSSTLFLTSYVIYHLHVGSRPFQGHGTIRLVYFTILLTHVLLAIVIVPMALITLSRALARRFPRHKAIARWTLPLWLYVSVTGVIVYLMLYQIQW
jgi:putative membrane protein